MEILQNFAINTDFTELFQQIAIYVTACRLFFKPFFAFWNKKVSPYVSVKPTEKLLKHPLYQAVVFIIDWTTSIKLPKEKK